MSEFKKPRLGFLFMIANDLPEIRHFYTDVIGLPENSYFEDDAFGWLSYHMGDLEMDWFRADTPQAISSEWACQPGYSGGTREVTSWAIEIEESKFEEVVEKCKEEKYPLFQEEPQFRQESYWGFTVRDPMGNTVELYYVPSKK
ncbi:MAG TPA: hypothetical protein PK581_07505 [Caldisericia bacterium]|jgi:catechol 2,3-dioxygenase-like lactoylglutathione lyase family enzyme|nr:hypothetical protein [Caldisericia bacterium]